MTSWLTAAANWADNLGRLVRGRPSWSAAREFDYYRVEPHLVREHRDRQEAFAREAYSTGLRIVRALDLLDTAALSGACVLDLGAGECLLSETLAHCGAREVWATDAVPKQIWAAAERHARSPRLRFLIADAQDLPFADGSFDLVVANLVLHHIEPLRPLLSEVLRVLRPGGRFAAFEPTPLIGALVHERTSENEAPIAPGQVRGALAEAGYTDVRASYFWSRMETGRLGPLSPGYRVSATRPGAAAAPVSVRLRRPVEPMALPGLQLDAGCSFAGLARAQEREILRVLGV